jgi:hypothetical protein
MTNEVQRFDILGSPGSGKFTLTVLGATTDPPMAYHPAAGVVQSAIEALPPVGVGNVVVTKDGNWGYVCGFTNALGDQDIPQMTADDSQLGGGATIQVSTVIEGGPEIPPPDGGEPLLILETPCTALALQRFATEVAAVTSGAHREFPVTTTASQIAVG